MLDRCRERNLKLNKDKCRFRVSDVSYVGHVLSADGIKPDPLKVEAVKAVPPPGDRKELQRFAGCCDVFVQVHSKHVPKRCSTSTATSERCGMVLGQAENEAFENLKTAVSSTPVLKFFNPKEPVSL